MEREVVQEIEMDAETAVKYLVIVWEMSIAPVFQQFLYHRIGWGNEFHQYMLPKTCKPGCDQGKRYTRSQYQVMRESQRQQEIRRSSIPKS